MAFPMTIKTFFIETAPLNEGQMEDITPEVRKKIHESGIKEGSVIIFNVGSTGAITTVEFEPGLMEDIPRALERIAPRDEYYRHHETWHDDNGRGHVKATLMGPSLCVPFAGGEMILGTWQQIVALNLDTSLRKRKIAVQVTGE